MLLTLPVSAQTPIVLELPLDWQVIQRNAQEWPEIKVAGTAPAGATVVAAKAEPGDGMRGKALAWSVVAKGVNEGETFKGKPTRVFAYYGKRAHPVGEGGCRVLRGGCVIRLADHRDRLAVAGRLRRGARG